MRRSILLLTLLACLPLVTPAAPDALSLEGRVAQLLPSASEERWLTIPWRTDLLQARFEANQTGRPLFMWLMDGDPLGCT